MGVWSWQGVLQWVASPRTRATLPAGPRCQGCSVCWAGEGGCRVSASPARRPGGTTPPYHTMSTAIHAHNPLRTNTIVRVVACSHRAIAWCTFARPCIVIGRANRASMALLERNRAVVRPMRVERPIARLLPVQIWRETTCFLLGGLLGKEGIIEGVR